MNGPIGSTGRNLFVVKDTDVDDLVFVFATYLKTFASCVDKTKTSALAVLALLLQKLAAAAGTAAAGSPSTGVLIFLGKIQLETASASLKCCLIVCFGCLQGRVKSA